MNNDDSINNIHYTTLVVESLLFNHLLLAIYCINLLLFNLFVLTFIPCVIMHYHFKLYIYYSFLIMLFIILYSFYFMYNE